MTRRIAVIGAGHMARVRAKAFLATGNATLCGVASRTLSSARKFGGEIGCRACFDNIAALADTSPDAVLVEVPHGVQDAAVLWALRQGFHVLIGGCLASSSAASEEIRSVAAHAGLVVEAGYEARYSAVWEAARRLVAGGDLGKIAVVRSIALCAIDANRWYYQQQESGGMPLTHMTYCFINPIRWILGDPVSVSAQANSIRHTEPGMITEETCVANMQFAGDIIYSMTASFIKPGEVPGWSILFLGSDGAATVCPREHTLTIYRDGATETREFSAMRSPFETQAEVFLAALDGRAECRNAPDDTLGDIRVAEAIATSCRQRTTVWINDETADGRQADGDHNSVPMENRET